jgi:hypothetical protein
MPPMKPQLHCRCKLGKLLTQLLMCLTTASAVLAENGASGAGCAVAGVGLSTISALGTLFAHVQDLAG